MGGRIVLALSGKPASERGVGVALDLARLLGQPLHAVTFVEDGHEVATANRYLRDILRAGATDSEQSDSVSVSSEAGVAAHASAALAELADGNTTIVMATSGSVMPHDHHVGSAAEAVARIGGSPVFLVGPNCDITAGAAAERVIVPVDGSPLSELAIEMGKNWAKRLNSQLWLTTVVSDKAQRIVSQSAGPISRAVESAYLKRLAGSAPNVQWEVLHGDDPGEAIAREADRNAIVAMSTRGRSGLSRLTIGSVGNDVVRRALRPVILWRPPT